MSDPQYVPTDSNISLKDQHIRWSVRRRMTVASLAIVVAIVSFHYYVALGGENAQITALKDFSNITITVILGCFSTIGAYIGFKAFSKGGA